MLDSNEELAPVDPSTGQFIDPMFAVAIASAVTETFVAWVKTEIPMPTFFGAVIVFVGYINLLLSWFGYHKSVHRKPIRGGLRFIITVVLLPLYILTIILYAKPFVYTALTYAAIFFLWSLWEHFKYMELKEKFGFWRLQTRLFNLIAYFSCGYICVIYFYWGQFHPDDWYVKFSDQLSIVMITVAIFFLRISKSANIDGSPAYRIKSEILILCFGPRT